MYISETIVFVYGTWLPIWEVSQLRSVHVAKQNVEFTSSYPLADPVIS